MHICVLLLSRAEHVVPVASATTMCTLEEEMTATPGTKSWKRHIEHECTCTKTCDARVNLELK